MGWTRRQHDPDWEPDGTITVFDNNMHRGESRILRFDPAADDPPEVILDGREYDFYTWIRGNHQTTDGDTILVTSPQQGRVFEVDEDGQVVFELINAYGKGSDERLVLSNAIRLPNDYFNEGVFELVRAITFLIVILAALPANAYVGPGLGAGLIAAISGFFIALGLALYAVLWLPVRRMMRKKPKKDGDNPR